MGQKVHPYVLRIGFAKTWQSLWFSSRKKEFSNFLEEDIKIRRLIKNSYPQGSITHIVIERVSLEGLRIRVKTSRPGVIIGRRGQDIERVKSEIQAITKKEVFIDVEEVAKPTVEAQLIAELIGFQIVRRVNFRRAMKKAIGQALAEGCQGIKIRCSGRLGGLEIARSEVYKQGKIPLQTFRSDIDYGYAIAKTTYGTIGVKTWVYRGEAGLGTYLKRPEELEGSEGSGKRG
ncbi:MAG: 30S ribosomal protein S3 [Candidatus Omnitrophica bacterium]|nr:30S ribosomal protein S3 [Candidatus Omnitrophota bacterium]